MPGVYTQELKTKTFTGKISFNTGLFINGQYVDAADNETIEVLSPVDGKVITKVACASARDVDAAAKAAEKAFRTTWGLKTSGYERGRLLNKLADLLEAKADELAAIEAINCGKMWLHARHMDLIMVLSILRYFAGWSDKVTGKTVESDENKFAYTRREPIGVCGLITPWNFPLMILMGKLAPALAAGNTVVVKPSELTPLTALKMGELINEAGFPPGVVNIVVGYGSVAGQAISEHPLVRKVSLTGSTLTGRMILETSAKTNLKGTTLELGGKSPVIVFDDANLEQAIGHISRGIFFHSGQMCSAGSRIYVQEGIYEKFMQDFAKTAQLGKRGDIFDPETSQGPVTSKAQFDRVMDYIASGKHEGAKVYVGGDSDGGQGYYVRPTIFTGTTPDMKIVREEIFGPVAIVEKFKDEAEALALANNTEYGLASCVYTTNLKRAIGFANELESGGIYVNQMAAPDIHVPFGGIKLSGHGLEMSEYAMETYTNVKSVQINLGP